MSFLSFLFPRHKHPRPEQALDEAKKLLLAARITNGHIMDSLKNLQDAAAQNGTLLDEVETFINTLEASTDPANTVAAADVDAVTATIQANNAKLKTLLPDSANAPTTGTNGDNSGASIAGTVGGVNDGTQNGTAQNPTP